MAFTEQNYAAYEKFICGTFNVNVVKRDDIPRIKDIAQIIDTIRIFAPNMPKGDEWIKSWSFAFANQLLIAETADPAARAAVLAHEAQHGVQWHHRTPQADVPQHFHFWWLYLIEQEARVRLEVEAYRAGYEVERMLTGTVRSSDEVHKILEGGYALSAEQSAFAGRLYGPAEASIFHEIYSTDVGIASRRFFADNGIALAP